jgi:deoxyribodipyrimidine photo-lyase
VIHQSPTFQYERALVWFRRDLRDFDHAALYHALTSARQVFCVFIFDREILDRLDDSADRRVEFIWESVAELAARLGKRGGTLLVRHANARQAIPVLAVELTVQAVYANHDYEPSAQERDRAVADELRAHGIAFASSKDQVIFERDEVLSQSGKPFSVFTPYRNAWLRALTPFHLRAYPVDRHADHLARPPAAFAQPMPSLEKMGFRRTNLADLKMPTGMRGGARLFADFRNRIAAYKDARDFPATKGPSYLSVHLRFGTVSIRELAAFAHAVASEPDGAGAATWLSELIWRDFYAQILWHHPHVVSTAFRPQYANLAFPNDNAKFVAWCDGRTGYPIVDAAMRQLNQTGYMHNRLRMIVASFLVKDALIDWRWGERYFAAKLIDFDLASNNGGWQWAASTGCDAQPYFRIFNPVTQSERFDAAGTFIRRYVPELAALSGDAIHAPWQTPPALLAAQGIVLGRDYPLPIVDHAVSRRMALALFSGARGGEGI